MQMHVSVMDNLLAHKAQLAHRGRSSRVGPYGRTDSENLADKPVMCNMSA